MIIENQRNLSRGFEKGFNKNVMSKNEISHIIRGSIL